jgi:large subunit ribosomal protein L4
MPSAPLFNPAGERVGEAELADAIFGQAVRTDLVHQAVKRELANRRAGTHNTLTRAQVRGGGRKPYRQKGTGRARQGSTRVPHFRHGGVAHGPVQRDHDQAMPQKMRRAAFRSALAAKAIDGGVRVLEGFELEEISTRQFVDWLGRLELPGRTILVLAERNEKALLSSRNLSNVQIVVLPGLSTYEVVRADTLVFTQDALARLEEFYAR